LGWIIENRLDEAYLLSWPGELETYIPLHDTGGFDRARAPLGSYDWRVDQVKGTTKLHGENQVRIAFGTPAERPLPEPGSALDLVGTLERDLFQGLPRLRIRVVDYADADASPLAARRLMAAALPVGDPLVPAR